MLAPGDWTGRRTPAVARGSDEPRVGVSATVKHQALWLRAMRRATRIRGRSLGSLSDCSPSRLLLHCRLWMRAASARHPVGHSDDRHGDRPAPLTAGQAIQRIGLLIFCSGTVGFWVVYIAS